VKYTALVGIEPTTFRS